MNDMKTTIAIIGLGYVGLPLALAFGRQYKTIGIDENQTKVDLYRQGIDPSGLASKEHFELACHLQFTQDMEQLKQADYVIVAVPTPIDDARRPDFSMLIDASRSIGKFLKKGATVIYESTVYPGATEEICVPILEKYSGLAWQQDFFVGYSPERINPGDKRYTLEKIVKVVSGDNSETQEKVAQLYESIIPAGVHRASSIKVAEAAKVIENTQRDLNIALMNELAMLFKRMKINTSEVLLAANTKWNFLPFTPGLVGGHCIGVDPYYLTHKAEMLDYHPQVILAGRRINDGMGKFIAEETIKQMLMTGKSINNASINILGLTFKEDCPDMRNSRVVDIIQELLAYKVKLTIYDPLADSDEAYQEYKLELSSWDDLPPADAVILAVPHEKILERETASFLEKMNKNACLIDVKAALESNVFKENGISVWSL